jgi:phage-related protein
MDTVMLLERSLFLFKSSANFAINKKFSAKIEKKLRNLPLNKHKTVLKNLKNFERKSKKTSWSAFFN